MTNETRLINSTRQQIRFGSALVEAPNLPVSNGIISYRRLLGDIDANLTEIILAWIGLKDQIESTDWLVLAPTDKVPGLRVSAE
ncbi:hypothetical protein G6F43_007524 [Rhizopus delemar]|nr:hypothetical protein G6F43_007524 [Rhizopus delemar]